MKITTETSHSFKLPLNYNHCTKNNPQITMIPLNTKSLQRILNSANTRMMLTNPKKKSSQLKS